MYKKYFNHASQLIYIIARDGYILEINDAVSQLTGISKEEIIGKTLWELSCWTHSEEMQNMVLFSMEHCAMYCENARFAAQYASSTGDIVDLDFVLKPVFDENEMIEYFVGLGYNITDLVDARKALSDYERQMSSLFENANDGFLFNMLPESIDIKLFDDKQLENIILNEQKVVMWNTAFENIYGYIHDQIKSNSSLLNLLKLDEVEYAKIIKALVIEKRTTYEYNFLNNKNEEKVCEINLCPIMNEDLYYGFSCVISDITITRQYEKTLEKRAMTDFLTGLNNRRTFFGLALPIMEEKSAVAVCMFDIDKFKNVNDTYGHDTGDIVLKNFARLLSDCLGEYGVVARFGGEEFTFLVKDIDFDKAIEQIEDFRIKLSKTMHVTTDKQEIYVTVSIGVKDLRNTDIDIDQALNFADLCLYEAKNSGRNKVVVYDRLSDEIKNQEYEKTSSVRNSKREDEE